MEKGFCYVVGWFQFCPNVCKRTLSQTGRSNWAAPALPPMSAELQRSAPFPMISGIPPVFQALEFLQQKKMGRFKPLQAGEKLSQRQVPIPGEEDHLRSCTSKLHGIPQQAMDAQSRRSHRRTCQPTVAATSRVATILSAKVTIHASLLRGMGARGNI